MSAVRNFIITLILSLLIFGLIAYGIVQFALGAFGLDGKGDESQGTDSITVEPDGSVTDSPDDPKTWDDVKGDSFTVLLIGTDHQPSVYKDYGKSEGTDENGFPKDPRTVGADTMILVRVNKETGECHLRDPDQYEDNSRRYAVPSVGALCHEGRRGGEEKGNGSYRASG